MNQAPVGGNISDYTNLPYSSNTSTTMGPLANGMDYTKALGYQGMGPLANATQYGQYLQDQAQPSKPSFLSQLSTGLQQAGEQAKLRQQPMQQLQNILTGQPMQRASIQTVDLLSLLRNLGGQ